MIKVSNNIINVGVDDKNIDLFEGQYKVPFGMRYNSYLILDDKTCLLDTVDSNFKDEFLSNVKSSLGDRTLDYLVIHHMEPDHSALISEIVKLYPDVNILISVQGLAMLRNFFPEDENVAKHVKVTKEGDVLELGHHSLHFIGAPFIHWPEVMMSYEENEKVLFSADAFGRFGTYDSVENFHDESRRYYIGIVGKFGLQVKNLLNKALKLDIKKICSLHGNLLEGDLTPYIKDYITYANYDSEDNDVTIAYGSVYGHTKEAALLLKDELEHLGKKVYLFDLARDDIHEAISHAFAHKNLVIASVTYNNGLFPCVRNFIENLTERNFQKKNVSFIENGSWGPMANKVMKDLLANSKEINYIGEGVTVRSAINQIVRGNIKALAEAIVNSDN